MLHDAPKRRGIVTNWILPELDRLLRRARAEERAANAVERYQRTLNQVEGYLAAHPEATANRVHREIGGRRQDVLKAVKSARSRFPDGRNRDSGVSA